MTFCPHTIAPRLKAKLLLHSIRWWKKWLPKIWGLTVIHVRFNQLCITTVNSTRIDDLRLATIDQAILETKTLGKDNYDDVNESNK
jgi:hypothetical protein